MAVIIGLSVWVYSEYLNNTYFQSYVNSLSPILVPIVSVGFGITSATIATLLYFTMRNIRQRDELKDEDLPRRRNSTRKTIKKPQVSASRAERVATGGLPLMSKQKVAVTGLPGPKYAAAKESRDEEDESD